MQRTNRRILSFLMALVLLMCCGPFGTVMAASPVEVTIKGNWKGDTLPADMNSITVGVYKESDDSLVENVILKREDCWQKTITIPGMDTAEKYYAQWDGDTDYTTESLESKKVTEQKGSIFWGDDAFKHEFGTIEDFNVIAFGNFKGNDADVEGGLAVKGNFYDEGKYTVGLPDDKGVFVGVPIGFAIAPKTPRMIVGGNMEHAYLEVYGGDLYVKNTTVLSETSLGYYIIRKWEYTGAGTYGWANASNQTGPVSSWSFDYVSSTDEFDVYDWNGTNPQFVPDKVEQHQNGGDLVTGKEFVIKKNPAEIDSFFNGAETATQNISAQYKVMAAGADILVYDVDYNFGDNPLDRTLHLSHKASDEGKLPTTNYIVYNIKGTNDKFTNIDLNIPDTFTGKVIVNFLGSGGHTFGFDVNGDPEKGSRTMINGDAEYVTARKYSDRIIWNFPDGGDIIANSYKFFGSVLAPKSDYTAKSPNGAGNVNGILIAKNVDVSADTGWEAHNTAAGFAQPKEGAASYSLSLGISSTYTATSTPPVGTSSVSLSLSATKQVIDEAGKDVASSYNGKFSFTLGHSDGTLIETVKNVGGTVTFAGITYKEADIGTHYYKIWEETGAEKGITYDKAVYDIAVVVGKNGAGDLQVGVTYKVGSEGKSAVVFKNTYKSDTDPGKDPGKDPSDIAAKVAFEAKKVLTGMDLQAGLFTFVIKDDAGKVVSTAKNNADGTIVFPSISYTAAGTYHYTIEEIKGTTSGMTYDTTIYHVTVTVTDTSVAAYAPTDIVFRNTYKTPGATTGSEGGGSGGGGGGGGSSTPDTYGPDQNNPSRPSATAPKIQWEEVGWNNSANPNRNDNFYAENTPTPLTNLPVLTLLFDDGVPLAMLPQTGGRLDIAIKEAGVILMILAGAVGLAARQSNKEDLDDDND